MADVFISFIHEEKELAEAVQSFIKALLNDHPFNSIGHNVVFMASDANGQSMQAKIGWTE